MSTKTLAPLKRASEFHAGIGANLDSVADRDVAVVGYQISKRPVFDERLNATIEHTFTLIEIAEIDNGQPTEPPALYHTWSASLAERLAAIPVSNLPVLARFERTPSANGFSSWIMA